MQKQYLQSPFKIIAIICVIILSISSCSKTDVINLSLPEYVGGTPISDAVCLGSDPLKNAIKGTMLAGKTYTICGDVFVNAGDTLVIQPGAKIYIKGNYTFWIKGNLLSLGTKSNPIYFTVQGQTKKDIIGQDPTTDPAYSGLWGGLQGDTSTKFMILKFTHVEFAGSVVSQGQVFGVGNGAQTAPVRFVNENGMFVVEDSWFYGQIDGNASVRVVRGKFHIMRNIFEKSGGSGGECLDIANGSQGNIAYNLFIGPATNAIKIANGNGLLSQVDAVCYNNTLVNGGYRRFVYGGAGNSNGRGASINFERAGRGRVYNNLFVNNRYGLRVCNTFSYFGNNITIADTANIRYSNNYYYGDATEITSQFYPDNCLAKPQPTDIPNPAGYLPSNYTPGMPYNGASLVGLNNPKFINYPLPIVFGSSTVPSVLGTMSFLGNYDFHLQASSPCLGKGTTAFAISTAVTKLDAVYGCSDITPPGTDMGCYQSNGTGLNN
jgi:hypothetical protein